MSRKLRAAVAQLGPIHLADSRQAVVKRLLALLEEAHGAGARFVVFPELALTTFFPRYWMTDQRLIDSYFEREMPGPETQALFGEVTVERHVDGRHLGQEPVVLLHLQARWRRRGRQGFWSPAENKQVVMADQEPVAVADPAEPPAYQRGGPCSRRRMPSFIAT